MSIRSLLAAGLRVARPARSLGTGGFLAAWPRRLAASAAVLAVFAAGAAPVAASSGSVPAMPPRPNAVASVVDGAFEVTLSWSDPGDPSITGYQILRRDPSVDAAGQFHVIEDDTASADTNYVDDTVVAERTYVYRIQARNDHGLSVRSRYRRIDVPALPPQAEPTSTTSPELKATLRQLPPSSSSATHQECRDKMDAGVAVKCISGSYSVTTYGHDGVVWVDFEEWVNAQTGFLNWSVVIQTYTFRNNWRNAVTGIEVPTEGEHENSLSIRYTYAGQDSCAPVVGAVNNQGEVTRWDWRCTQPSGPVLDSTDSVKAHPSTSWSIGPPPAPRDVQATLMQAPTGSPSGPGDTLTQAQLDNTIEATATEHTIKIVFLQFLRDDNTFGAIALTTISHY